LTDVIEIDRPGTWKDRNGDRHYKDPLDPFTTWTGVSAILGSKSLPWLEKAKRKAIAEHAARHRKRFATVPRAPDVVAELLDEQVTLPKWQVARDDGTAAHLAIDDAAHGRRYTEYYPPEDPRNWGLRHWDDFVEDTGFTVLQTELTVCSDKFGYGGSFDCFGHFPSGRTCLMDFKTNAKGPKHDVALQLELYDRADFILDCTTGERTPWARSDGHKVLWMRPDGWALVPIQDGLENANVWREAYARIITYRSGTQDGDTFIGEPEAGTLELPGPGFWG